MNSLKIAIIITILIVIQSCGGGGGGASSKQLTSTQVESMVVDINGKRIENVNNLSVFVSK